MKIVLCILVVFAITFASSAVSFANAKITTLTQKQQAIVPIASYTSTGDMDNLKKAINDGLDAGLTINETKEIMVHLYAYCGFPRALNGIGAITEVLNDRQAKGIHDVEGRESTPIAEDTNILEVGTKVQTKLAGAPVNYAVSPGLDQFLKTHLFGDLFARDVLSFEDRELITISALASMRGTQPQLMAHLRLGSNAGLSDKALQDIVNVLDAKVNSKIGTDAQKALDTFLNNK